MKYGKLTILEVRKEKQNGRARTFVHCKCECGNEVDKDYYKVTSGHTKSCGCLKSITATQINQTHGKSGTPLHQIWKSLRSRNVSLCEEWDDFETFYKDISEDWQEGYSISRKDPNIPYSPTNYKWKEQRPLLQINEIEQYRNKHLSGAASYEIVPGAILTIDAEDLELLERLNWRQTGEWSFMTDVRDGDKFLGKTLQSILLNNPDARYTMQTEEGPDFRKQNLRILNQNQKNYNRKSTSEKKTSQYKGVYWFSYRNTGKWRAKITFQGKGHSLGLYDIEEDAAEAYDAAAKKFFGEYAHLNFPDKD